MSIYARIQNNTAVEIIAPLSGFTLAECYAPAIVAQCVDITTASPAPQVGWTATEANGAWAFAAPVAAPAPVPTLAEQATTQLTSGVAVTFATSTALSATYSTTLAAQLKIMAEANWLIKNGAFINGSGTLVLVDTTGTQRSFSPAQFAAFEAAYAPYISAVDLVADSNQGTLPAAALAVDA